MMLKGICLGVFSLAILSFSTSSPLQGGNVKERRQLPTITVAAADVQATAVITPVTGMTSTKTTTRSALLVRSATDALPIPKVTGTPNPSLASPPTPTASSAIVVKSGVRNCNVEGTASDYLSDNILGGKHVSDVLACQRACMYMSRCEAYSYQPRTGDRDGKNCLFYTALIDGKYVDTSKKSGIFFSDKYPADGSDFCYGTSEL